MATILLAMVGLCRKSYNIFKNAEQEVFTSPQGTNTFIEQCDFVYRQTAYKSIAPRMR